MITRRTLLSAILLSSASVASAQTVGGPQPAAQPQTASQSQPLGGPVVDGVCLLSREAIFANAAVGKAASARLGELTEAVQAEVDAERAQLEIDTRALEGNSAATDENRQALATRWQALQRRAAHASREIEATRSKAMSRIANEAQPVIAEVYRQKNCGLLFDRNSALGGNFANDLTSDVVTALDARIQTITFERERLPDVQPQPSGTDAAVR
ncbi:OmpH family outer membrane protein [Altericroceibacterium spongiae]|uniref:OmpH family outer membrane protein n=1 Tax=Altericroceibacterium spongiae TaxID=2320269 RepID=A0A420EP25_9SPHN|nr:OmpH family outer membrane protein [Altericroceibacterium spongiae]RKF22420.1 OmpH family outer membrane protein [Altericroceibacterium spongiae]